MKTPKAVCTARSSRTGKHCRKAPIAGGTVCRTHGGAAPQVQRKAAERLADLIDPKRALREAARLAYSDIRDLCDGEGRLLPMRQWPDHIAAAVSSIKIRMTKGADGEEQVAEIKLWDKPRNVDLLFRHLRLVGPEAARERPAPARLVIAIQRRPDGVPDHDGRGERDVVLNAPAPPRVLTVRAPAPSTIPVVSVR